VVDAMERVGATPSVPKIPMHGVKLQKYLLSFFRRI